MKALHVTLLVGALSGMFMGVALGAATDFTPSITNFMFIDGFVLFGISWSYLRYHS